MKNLDELETDYKAKAMYSKILTKLCKNENGLNKYDCECNTLLIKTKLR